MSWKKLKSKLSEQDMDDEFEKFMNESLSDESASSPRRSITPRVSRSNTKILSSQPKNKFEKPWWATSEDDEKSGLSEVVKKSWLKKKEQDSADEGEGVVKASSNLISKDSLEVTASRPGTALDTILSEPEYSVKFEVSNKSDSISKASKSNISYTSDSDIKSDISDDDGNQAYRKNDVDLTETLPPGMETLDELNDKEAFFNNIEKGAADTVDYGRLNKQFDADHYAPLEKDATLEVGLQLYKQTYSSDEFSSASDDEKSINSKTESFESKIEDQKSTSLVSDKEESSRSVDHSISTNKDQQSDQTSGSNEKVVNDEDTPVLSKNIPEIEKLKSSSMLSKVALMESLESTYGTSLVEKLSKIKKFDRTEFKEDQLNLNNTDKETSVDHQLDTTCETSRDARFETGRTTTDLAEVLQNVKNLSSHQLNEFLSPPDQSNTINGMSASVQPVQSSMLVLDKEQEGTIQVNPFDLQPVISNINNEPKVPLISSHYKQELKCHEETPNERYKIIQDEINETIKSEMEKVLVENLNSAHGFKTHPNKISYDAHGFDLQPIENEDAHGFDLQPIEVNDAQGFDSRPIVNLVNEKDSSVNVESKHRSTLKLNKSSTKIDQILNSYQPSKSDNKKKGVASKVTPVKHTSSYQQATITSTRKSNIPKPTSTVSTHNKSNSQVVKKKKKTVVLKRTPNKRNSHADGLYIDTQQKLITSMENMASCLKTFSTNQASSNILSKSFTIERDDHIESLTREQALQRELQQLRLLYEEEKSRNEALHIKIKSIEQKWKLRHEELLLTHDANVKEYQDAIQVLKKKIEMSENSGLDSHSINDQQKLCMTEEETSKLQQQIEQQETLLTGYQQENERLYSQIKKHQVEKKKYESSLLKENQKLANEVANLKEQYDMRTDTSQTTGSASLGAHKITQLTNQVKFYQTREREYKEEVLNLENEVSSLKHLVTVNEKQKIYVNEKGLQNEIENLKVKHLVEVDKLTKRLKWYSENQDMIDRDVADLSGKRGEIKDLRDLIGRLEDENKKLKSDDRTKKVEKTKDNKKILDLQRQVKEMEDIIKRRYPNSIPAMIYAASAVPNEVKSYEKKNEVKDNSLNVFLEKRVKTLEDELENKDIDNSKKIRAIEQNYNSMTFRYEEHIKQLESKISELTLNLKTAHSSEALENELINSKFKFQDIINNLKSDLETKQAEIISLKLKINDKIFPTDNNDINMERQKSRKSSSKSYVTLNNDISRLREKLRHRDNDIIEYKTTISLLQKDRGNLLSKIDQTTASQTNVVQIADNDVNGESKQYSNSQPVRQRNDDVTSVVTTHVYTDLKEKYSALQSMNAQLQTKIEELVLEMEEKRLKVEAVNANLINEKRKLNEHFEEKITKLEEKYEKRFEKQKYDYVMAHSNSKVGELSGKLKSYEFIMEHMKNSMEEAKEDRKKMQQVKENETHLLEKIKTLEMEINEAKSLQSPEMFHYKALQSKILSIENRHSEKEKELQNIINRVKYKASVDIDQLEDKWRDILRSKDQEIQTFRQELDSMLEVLEELHRQGVKLPNRENEYL